MRFDTTEDEKQAALWAVKMDAGNLTEKDEANLRIWLENLTGRQTFLKNMLRIQRLLRAAADFSPQLYRWIRVTTSSSRNCQWLLP